MAQTLDNLAVLYEVQGRYGEAEQLYKRALTIREKMLGRDHTEVADALNGLALVNKAQGKYVTPRNSISGH